MEVCSRCFQIFFAERPTDIEAVVKTEPPFITTFLIQDAIRQGVFTLVCNLPVAPTLVEFSTFRFTNNLRGDDTMWFFWRGEKQRKVHRPLTEEEKRYPRGPSLPSAPLLVEMIEKNYRAEVDYI